MPRALILLSLAACATSSPSGWRVEGPEPSGWRDVMTTARAQATCHLEWGGVIDVVREPFECAGWGPLASGCVLSEHHLRILYAPMARDTALGEEACHVVLRACGGNSELAAGACAARVREALP